MRKENHMRIGCFSNAKGLFQPFARRSQHGGYLPMGIDIKDWNNVENKQLG